MGAAEAAEALRRAEEEAEEERKEAEIRAAAEAEEARRAAEAAEAMKRAEEERKEADIRASEEVLEARKVAETAREVSIPKTEARMQASNGEILPSTQLKESKQVVANGVSLIKEEANGVSTAVRESEKAKAKDEAKNDEATKAAIEQAKSVAEETIGKIEAVLGRQDGASGDAAY